MARRKTSSDRPRRRKPAAAGAGPSPRPRTRGAGAEEQARTSQAQLLHSVQQVWLAGMGAIARAQKDGPSAFTDAVFEGLRLLNQSRSTAQRMVRDAFETAQETLQTQVGGARGQAQETWDNLESLFQGRVQRAMHQVGVPTAEEIRVLTRRVAELNETVKQLEARERAASPAAARGSRQRARPPRRKAAPVSDSE